jgi:hypothetical protein
MSQIIRFIKHSYAKIELNETQLKTLKKQDQISSILMEDFKNEYNRKGNLAEKNDNLL